MIELREVDFAYNAGRADAIPALEAVNLTFREGELVAIIGHNGSGKSTLAKLLCGMLWPTAGEVTVDSILSTPRTAWEVRRRVGMVFQNPDDQLVANTVVDDVAFGPENLGLPPPVIDRQVADALAAVELTELAGAQIHELSVGQKQRVAVAGVLAMRPRWLIFDEPTSMLGPDAARRIVATARDLNRREGTTVLYITHFMPEVVHFDRVIVMDARRVIMDAPPRAVFARAEELAARRLDVPLVTKLAGRLRARGLPLPATVLDVAELRAGIGPHPLAPSPTGGGGRSAGIGSATPSPRAALDGQAPGAGGGGC